MEQDAPFTGQPLVKGDLLRSLLMTRFEQPDGAASRTQPVSDGVAGAEIFICSASRYFMKTPHEIRGQ